jgi:hypothetical protein
MLQRLLDHECRQLSKREAASVLKAVNPAIDLADFDSGDCLIYSKNLDFYPGYRLLDINSRAGDPVQRVFVIYCDDERFEVLDWSNKPIYRLNDQVPIKLDRDNVHDYVRMFFALVKGRKGRFHIVESIEDLDWKDDPPPSARKAIGNMLMPLTLVDSPDNNSGDNHDSAWHLRGVFNYRDMLFQSDVHVSTYARVRMDNEEILVENLPIFDENLAQ